MAQGQQIDIAKRIDALPLGRFQIRVVALCFLIALLEGYDTQVIAFVAPAIADEWGVERAALGPAFSSSLLGLMVGAIVLGACGDRFGRKTITIASFAAVGFFTLLTARATDMNELMLYRFLTGIGLGGTIPNAIALVSEYSPKRLRSTIVAVISAGFPLGAALGGIAASPLISNMGWRSAFILGGALPLMLTIVLILFLPESIRLLADRRTNLIKVGRLLARIDPTHDIDEKDEFITAEAPMQHGSIRSLFLDQRAIGTLLLWLLFALNLMMLYLMLNWLPTILSDMGFSLQSAIYAAALFNVGGILAGIALGRSIDTVNPYRSIGIMYLLAAVCTPLLAWSGSMVAAVFVLSALAGAAILGPQLAINALAANFYPTSIRSAGVGAALSAGRLGAIVGPIAGGLVLSLGWAPSHAFYFLAIPAVLCVICIYALQFYSRSED
ncbi:MFS transporter [Parasphingorhabdus sp.]|uniref:MFS transporter n=1 Tax=Parasphingorhabdus sp. TaxID=2709688 RepID=UPI003263BAEA